MTEAAIIERIGGLEGVDATTATAESGAPEIAWGDTFFIFDPDRKLTGAQQFPFATLVTKDYDEFDNASNLNRPGVFRLNIGVGTDVYESLFGPVAPDHLAGGGRDFARRSIRCCRTRSIRGSIGSASSIHRSGPSNAPCGR